MAADCIVLGASHNGLAAAATLAAGGRRVVIIEPRDVVGGLAAGEEFHPGFRTTGLLHDSETLLTDLIGPLDLPSRGLGLREPPRLMVPRLEGAGVVLSKSGGDLAKVSPEDAHAWGRRRKFLDKVRPFLRKQLLAPTPAIDSGAALGPLARRAVGLRRLGRKDMMELLRIAPTCVDDWLGEWFNSPLVRAALAAPALTGTWMGPRSPGSTAALLVREALSGKEAAGGPAALVAALERACLSYRVKIRTGEAGARIRLENGRARGVELPSGEYISANLIFSAHDPKTTFLKLLPPDSLPLKLEETVNQIRTRGLTAKVHLALSGPLEFACRPGERFERVRVGEHPHDLERAFDAAKYRRLPDAPPPMDIRVPTVSDPSLAPDGGHVVSILLHGIPYHLDAGWGDEARSKLGELTLTSLERYCPDIRDRLVGMEVLTPADIEARYGVDSGQVYHAEHALDQLWIARPTYGMGDHATPIENLYLAGAGSHPGGGITCGPGVLAARKVLQR